VVLVLVIILAQGNGSFGLQYSNYVSNKYRIQFQYPYEWQLKENVSESEDITIDSLTNTTEGFISINLLNRLITNLAFDYLFDDTFKLTSDGDYAYELIDGPTFTKIDHQETGTYTYTMKSKYNDNAIKFVEQYWLVHLPDRDYFIWFTSTKDNFDSPETTQVRDHFIKSIKLSDIGDITKSNILD
jgi:hypothetical protein